MQKLGVFWKIQDICYNMGTEIFKIEEVGKFRNILPYFIRPLSP